MRNKSDIKEPLPFPAKVLIAAGIFVLGWIFGAILIAENCGPLADTVPPTFTVFNDTFTCSRVGG